MIYKFMLIFFMLLISTCSMGYAESGSTLFDNGIAEFQKGRYQDAIFWFTKLIEKEPFNAKAYKNRGVARLSLQKYDMAIEDLNNALNPDPQLEDLAGTLSPAWHYKDEYKKAMDDFNSALNLDPDLEGIHSNIGVAWYYAREYKKAIEEYSKEIKKFPENYSAFFNRALSWVELKEYENALNDLETVLNIKPDEYWAIAYQGDIYSELKNLAAARESYLAAMALNTGNKYAGDKLRLLDARISALADQSEKPLIDMAAQTDIQSDQTPAQKDQAMPKSVTVTSTQKDQAVLKSVIPTTKSSLAPVEKKTSAPPRFSIQLGAFLDSKNATELIKSLEERGYNILVLNMQDKKNRQWTLVRTGGFETKKQAKDRLDEIKKDLKIDGAIRPFDKL